MQKQVDSEIVSEHENTKGIDLSNSDTFFEHFQLDSDNGRLTNEELHRLRGCLFANKDLFVTKDNPSLGYTKLVEHKIHLRKDAKSAHQRAHRLSPEKKEILRYQLDELLRQGIIAPVSDSEDVPITSPMLIVSKVKKDGTCKKQNDKTITRDEALRSYRFCCDFRYLNSQIEELRYTIPDLQDLTESFTARVPNYLTSIDQSSGFFQMGISPESTRFTAFNTCYGTYKFLRAPMGLRTSPGTFQLLMDKVLRGLTFKAALCYIDDVLISSETFDEHISDLSEVFSRFRQAGLKLRPEKCRFARSEVVYLGHSISKEGISPPKDRVKALEEFRRPTDVKSLRRFLGMVGWFRKFIKNFSALADPLYLLLKKDAPFYWTDNQESAFQGLKDALVNSPLLAFPRFDLQFRLAVDTCNRGIGFMLYQFHSDDPDSLRVVRFGSKALSKWQRSYGPTKLELLGMTTAIMECASYLRGQAFVVECDHQALRPMFQKKLKGAIYERWMTILQQFNFEIQYRSASQMVVADALSRGTPKDAEPMIDSPDDEDPHFPYKEDKTGKVTLPTGQSLASLLVHCDSSSAPEVNHVTVLPRQEATIQGIDDGYDADTDEDPQAVRGKKTNVPFKQKTQPVSIISSRDRLVEGISPLKSKVPCLHLPNKMGDKTDFTFK